MAKSQSQMTEHHPNRRGVFSYVLIIIRRDHATLSHDPTRTRRPRSRIKTAQNRGASTHYRRHCRSS
ncbi:hypothetical protein [Moraxella lacunata]|uniref:hypothetical protein n=1 Tax=Moraxella lacunata TaxID=477 RepID=UPI003EE01C0A